MCNTLDFECNWEQENIKNLSSKIAFKENFLRIFLAFFELPDRFLVVKNQRINPYLIKVVAQDNPIKIEKPFKRLKDFQNNIFENALEQLKIVNQRLILQMPTGSGKARTAMEMSIF